MAYHPIENYGIVGDLHTVALIAENASIDFMCFPRFDSPTVFAGLLDANNGGCFKIHPILEPVRHKQLYLPDSNVLVSRFLSGQGVAEVSDFMPVKGVSEPHTLVRRARTVRGEVRFRMLCAPRFDYGRAHHTVERVEDGLIFTSRGRDGTALRLRATVPVQVANSDGVAEFTLSAGNSADFVLEPATLEGASPSCAQDYVVSSFKSTINYWRRWIARSNYQGRWREMVTALH